MCICRNQYRFSPANVKSRFSTNLQVIITPPLLRSMIYRCNGSTKSSNVCRKKKLPNGSLIYSPNPKNKPSNCKKVSRFSFYLCVTPLHFSFLISSPLPSNSSHWCWMALSTNKFLFIVIKILRLLNKKIIRKT